MFNLIDNIKHLFKQFFGKCNIWDTINPLLSTVYLTNGFFEYNLIIFKIQIAIAE